MYVGSADNFFSSTAYKSALICKLSSELSNFLRYGFKARCIFCCLGATSVRELSIQIRRGGWISGVSSDFDVFYAVL